MKGRGDSRYALFPSCLLASVVSSLSVRLQVCTKVKACANHHGARKGAAPILKDYKNIFLSFMERALGSYEGCSNLRASTNPFLWVEQGRKSGPESGSFWSSLSSVETLPNLNRRFPELPFRCHPPQTHPVSRAICPTRCHPSAPTLNPKKRSVRPWACRAARRPSSAPSRPWPSPGTRPAARRPGGWARSCSACLTRLRAILWVEEILHHLTNPGIMIPL